MDPPALAGVTAPTTSGDAAAPSTLESTRAQSLGLPPLGTPDQQTRHTSSSNVQQASTTRPVNRYRPNQPSKPLPFRPQVSTPWDTARDAYEQKRKAYWSNKLGIPLFLWKVDDNGRTYMWQDGKKFYLTTRSNVIGPEQAEDSYPVRTEIERPDDGNFDNQGSIIDTENEPDRGSGNMDQHYGSVSHNLFTDLDLAMDNRAKSTRRMMLQCIS